MSDALESTEEQFGCHSVTRSPADEPSANQRSGVEAIDAALEAARKSNLISLVALARGTLRA
jgi:hypothetical protein